jgi:hypothetical protein
MTARKRNPGHTKWEKLYILQGNYGYGHGWEDLAAESQDKGSLKARRAIGKTRREYEENEGGRYRVIERRELRSKDNPDRSAPHGLSKAEEKRVRSEIQQDLVGAFMRALNDYAPSTINKNKIGYGNRLLDAYKSRPGATGFYAIKERYFGGHSASAKARKWLNSVTDARWDTIIRAAAKEAIDRHRAKNPRKKAPARRKNAMATKKISSFRGDDKRVAKGMMTKGYRYYLKVPGVPAMYAKTIKMATELVKDYDRGYGSTFGTKGAKVYKLVK